MIEQKLNHQTKEKIMRFREYVARHHINLSQMAIDVGIPYPTLVRVHRELSAPREKVSNAIVKYTNGEVTHQDLQSARLPVSKCEHCGSIYSITPKKKRKLMMKVDSVEKKY